MYNVDITLGKLYYTAMAYRTASTIESPGIAVGDFLVCEYGIMPESILLKYIKRISEIGFCNFTEDNNHGIDTKILGSHVVIMSGGVTYNWHDGKYDIIATTGFMHNGIAIGMGCPEDIVREFVSINIGDVSDNILTFDLPFNPKEVASSVSKLTSSGRYKLTKGVVQ